MENTFSNRTNWNFSENKLSFRLKSLKDQGVAIIDLSESNPTRCNFNYLTNLELLKPLTHPNNLKYNPSTQGKKEAREAIQSYYQSKCIEVDLKCIFLTSSTSEAYNYIFRLITNPNDHILIPRPSYPLFNFIAELNDIELDYYPIQYRNDEWQTNFKEIQNVHRDAKAVVLVHPNNPTGSFVKTKETQELIKIAKSKSLSLISDEVFLDYWFDKNAERVVSFSNTQEILTFTLGGTSKCLGLPQMKLSWIVISGPEKTVNQAIQRLEIIADTYLSVNTPSQESLVHWFAHQNQIQNEIKERLNANRSWLSKQIPQTGITFLNSEGGWYAIIKLPDFKSEEEWALEFLEKDHVFVHPGYFFDFEEEAFVILSLLPESSQFQEGCQKILNRVRKIRRL